MEFRDWFIIGFVVAIVIAATVYVYMHPSEVSFATWASAMAAVYGTFHWFFLRDSKQPDADNGS